MDCREALNSTIKVFKLTAREIADNAGMSPQQLSKYRNGHHDIYADTLDRVIKALPKTARFYYLALLSDDEQ